jgi:hypothetical protein
MPTGLVDCLVLVVRLLLVRCKFTADQLIPRATPGPRRSQSLNVCGCRNHYYVDVATDDRCTGLPPSARLSSL